MEYFTSIMYFIKPNFEELSRKLKFMPAKLPTKSTGLKLFAGILLTVLTIGCKDIYDQEKYQKPDWLAGKLYTQISEQENLSTYKKCLELTGYDTILDRTGSYTVFAPNNEAFDIWLATHPEYAGSVENVPVSRLLEIVKIHIIQDAWTLNQIQLLDVDGWIDANDPKNNKPFAYKRQSILREPNTTFFINNDQGSITIVDSTRATGKRIVYTRSRKYVPIFFPDFFKLFNLTNGDYEFYFNRPYESGSIHFANSRVIGSEVFAENGFIYEVDQVVEPLLNVYQLLRKDTEGANYNYLWNLFRLFPEFRSDLDETNRQFEARAGLDFDTLYTLQFKGLPFNIHEELTGPNTNDDIYTLRYHNGILAPDDNAFESFIAEVMTGPSKWQTWESVPIEIKKIVLRNHMTASPIYPTDLQKGFYSDENDLIRFGNDLIEKKYFASNATFLGLNEVIVPRALTSVAGPVYLSPGYSTFLYSMEYSKVLPAIKKPNSDYSFFILDDGTMKNDSSLLFSWKDRSQNIYEIRAFDRITEKMEKMTPKILSKRILNQVGIKTPKGIANKEFIENLGGNYIVFDNTTNEVRGGMECTFGYRGDSVITVIAQEINQIADNGMTYRVNSWFNPPNNSMYAALSLQGSFFSLLKKAGLYDAKTFQFPFLTEGENYTIFIPSDQALLDYGANSLDIPELQNLLKYHFVRGIKIFTDGAVPSGNYSTLRTDESSTTLFKKFTPMTIQTGPDQLLIYDQSGNLLGTIYEDSEKTNQMITTDTDTQSSSVFDNITSSVIHEIDFVIHK